MFPIVALLGSRQVGKATLALQNAADVYGADIPSSHYFDLEDPLGLSRLTEPMLAL